jgi:hypothetical protein
VTAFSTVPGVRIRAKDPTPLDTFTIRGLSEARKSGRNAWVTRIGASTFMPKPSIASSAREIGRADARFRGACVVDENVEPPALTLNSFGGCRDTWVARGVDLEEGSPEFAGRSPPALCITCPDEHSVPDL